MGFRRDSDGDYHGEDANLAVADWLVTAPQWAVPYSGASTLRRDPERWAANKLYGWTAGVTEYFDTLEAALLWIHMEAANGS